MNENKENELLVEEHNEIQPDIHEEPRVRYLLSYEQMKAIIDTRKTAILKPTVEAYDPINIAHALEESSLEDLLYFFKSVNADHSAEIFTYLEQETKERVVEAFSSSELHKVLDDMATDDLVDFVDELPSNLIKKVLLATSPEDRAQVKAYLNFKEDSAGSLMTPEYFSIRQTARVKDTIDLIKKVGKEKETIWEIFVMDDTRRLVGTVTLDKLLESDDDVLMKDIMNSDFVSVQVNTDQEIVLQAFRKYDVSVIPVTNSTQRILGIITFDDAMDVASDENEEDNALTSGVLPSDEPYLKTSVLKMVKNYGVWLVVLLMLDTFISMVLSHLSTIGALAVIPLLTAFIPSIMGTNGNASDQTATVTIRELALGNISTKNYFKVMWKEMRAAMLTGLILSVVSFAWVLIELYSGMIKLGEGDLTIIQNLVGGNQNLFFILIATLISLTFLFSTVVAKFFGVTLPVIAKMLHMDPAVMSQPLISTVLDVTSLVIFFLMAKIVFPGL